MKTIKAKLLSFLLVLSLMTGLVGFVNVNNAYAASKKIHLKKKTVSLEVGKSYQQKLIDKKGKTIKATKVKWKSSKKSVAKISKKGKITALKPGTAKMTAKYKGKTYKFTVKVKSSFRSNYNKFKKYILNNGEYDDDLACYGITGTYEDEDESFEYEFAYDTEEDYISLWLEAEDIDGSGINASVTVDVSLDGDADPMCFIDFEGEDYEDEEIYDEEDWDIIDDEDEEIVDDEDYEDESIDLECMIAARKLSEKNNLKWSVSENESDYTGYEDEIQDLCNAMLDLGLGIWDSEIYDHIGLTLYDLGFTSLK